MPRWTEPLSTAVVRPRAKLMRVTMLVPFWASMPVAVMKTNIDSIDMITNSLRKSFIVLIPSDSIVEPAGESSDLTLSNLIYGLPRMEFRFDVLLLPKAVASCFRSLADKPFPFLIQSHATIQSAQSPPSDCHSRQRRTERQASLDPPAPILYEDPPCVNNGFAYRRPAKQIKRRTVARL